MKKLLCALILALALLASAGALSETTFRGRVIASETAALAAPFGGIIDTVSVRVGDPIDVGDDVACIRTTRVFAPMDGTVSGIFAREGDETEGIVERYGGVMYIEPTNRYIVSASNEKAYNSSATRLVHIGETVYLSCTKDGSHTATAVVIHVGELDDNGNTPFKLEVTGGDLYMGETVGIFRDKAYSASARIGRGVVQQNAAVAVKGSGSVLRIHVAEGQHVERGQLLFECVDGTLDGLYAIDNQIVSGLAGIVASVDVSPGGSVEKNAKLITIYPRDSFLIEVKVSEMDLAAIREGDQVAIEFEWDADGVMRLEGTVRSISHVNDTASGTDASASDEASYSACIAFDAPADVRLGMSVIVYAPDATGDESEETEEDS